MKMGGKILNGFWTEGRVDDCPVYDMHGHMGAFSGAYLPFHGADEAVRRMRRAGVKLLAFSHHSALNSPDEGNTRTIEAARKFPGCLKGYCVINPHYPANADRDMADYDKYGDVYIGLKLHPDLYKAALTAPGHKKALDFAEEKKLIVLVHTWGGSVYNGVEEVKKTLKRYKKAVIILGHSLHGSWEEAAGLAREFPNAYLDLCAVLDERSGILELLVKKGGSEKILFGTDFPWFSHHYYIGGVLAADIKEEEMRNIFYRNAVRLLGRCENPPEHHKQP